MSCGSIFRFIGVTLITIFIGIPFSLVVSAVMGFFAAVLVSIFLWIINFAIPVSDTVGWYVLVACIVLMAGLQFIYTIWMIFTGLLEQAQIGHSSSGYSSSSSYSSYDASDTSSSKVGFVMDPRVERGIRASNQYAQGHGFDKFTDMSQKDINTAIKTDMDTIMRKK